VTDDVLAGFDRFAFTHEGSTRDVYRAGSGPAVVVVHEIPGLHPGVVEFGRRVVGAGCTAYLPSLFGTPGRPVSRGYEMASLLRCCVSREFTLLATGRTSPVVGWLRALAARAHADCGGPGVGAVGMCLTGGFALGMMVDARVRAPVLSQPSLPIPLPVPSPASARRRGADLGVPPADLARIRERVADGACLLGLRFSEDPAVPAARFEALRRELGDGFIAVEIDSSKGNPHGIPAGAHSVLTRDLVDEPGHPTRQALDRVLEFFRDRLGVTGS
jgi:dienelactone hydrolase